MDRDTCFELARLCCASRTRCSLWERSADFDALADALLPVLAAEAMSGGFSDELDSACASWVSEATGGSVLPDGSFELEPVVLGVDGGDEHIPAFMVPFDGRHNCEMPWLPYDSVLLVRDALNGYVSDLAFAYDASSDSFSYADLDDCVIAHWEGRDFDYDGATVHLYPVEAMSWIWSLSSSVRVAEGIH